jgi:hypothetical protein
MTLCPECTRAEDDRLHAFYTGQLCCYARALMAAPKRLRRDQAFALKRSLTPDEWRQVKARLDVLVESERADTAGACEEGPSVSRRSADESAAVPGFGEARKPGTDQQAEAVQDRAA